MRTPQAVIPAPDRSGRTASLDVPLHWCSYGPGSADRALVLHGGPGAHHDYLLPQFLRLARNRELMFYDQRGGGRSKETGGRDVTWQVHVDDLARVVRELSLEPLTLIGYSWGALLALLYSLEAHRHRGLPPPVRLVLVDPAPLSRSFRETFEAEFARRQRSEALRELREDLAASGIRETNPDAWRQRQFELGVAPYFSDPASASRLTPFRVTQRVQQSVWDSLGDFDLLPELGSLRIPAFFVHGRDDPIPLASTEMGAHAMGARLLVLEGCGHVPHVEKPDALFAALDQFLMETSSANG